MNPTRLFTVTRDNGLRAVRGATFQLQRLADGRHFLKSREGQSDGVQIDASLLVSPYAFVHPGASMQTTEVTLTSAGIGCHGGKYVLVAPEVHEGPYAHIHLIGLPGLIWFPEVTIDRVDRRDGLREAKWLMPGLVRLLAGTRLWMEWTDPCPPAPPSSLKVEVQLGDLVVEDDERRVATSKIQPVC
jgi:hypothetical protein